MLIQKVEEEKMIEGSWKLCYDFGLHPAEPLQDQLLNEEQIHELLTNNQELTRSAIPILEKLSPVLTKSGHLASIADRQGTIIYTMGDAHFEKIARKTQMQVGANWLEEKRGTNAIGVALREKNPVRIHGDQHFYINARFLTCAASPIFSPAGEIIGAINISGKKEQYNPYNFLLSQIIADDIRNRLLYQQSHHDHKITLNEIEFITNRYIQEPLISFDENDRILRANLSAKRLLGQNCIGKRLINKQQYHIEKIQSDSYYSHSLAIQKKTFQNKKAYTFSDIHGTCKSILQVKKMAKKAALTNLPILILGETGTGKELFAQSIHTSSLRSHHPFVAVNCSAIPESLIESELFGYIGGAFTGAHHDGRIGKFEAANHGTIFLDEIGDMSMRAQASLLRALQENEITPVGSVKSKQIDVRVIAATNKNLLDEIKAGRFRADLYYRLKGIQLTLPALRNRTDLIEIAKYILSKLVDPNKTLSVDAKQKILAYAWPGNMRELTSVLSEASFLAEGDIIWPDNLQIDSAYEAKENNRENFPSLKSVEKNAIEKALRISFGNVSNAAQQLQISRNTLYRKMKEYDIPN